MARPVKLRWPLVFTGGQFHNVCHPFYNNAWLSDVRVVDWRYLIPANPDYSGKLCVYGPGRIPTGCMVELITPSMLEVRCYLEGLLDE